MLSRRLHYQLSVIIHDWNKGKFENRTSLSFIPYSSVNFGYNKEKNMISLFY